MSRPSSYLMLNVETQFQSNAKVKAQLQFHVNIKAHLQFNVKCQGPALV